LLGHVLDVPWLFHVTSVNFRGQYYIVCCILILRTEINSTISATVTPLGLRAPIAP
jgi:hypothetical protein